MRVLIFTLLLLLPGSRAESELGKRLESARNRMLCPSDAECLNEQGILRLLNVKSVQTVDTEDLSLVLAHHFLHGDSSCTVQLLNIAVLEDEVMRAIETEGIPGILRIFKRILNDGEGKECVTTESILKKMPPDPSYLSAMQWIRSVLSILIENVLEGHCIDSGSTTGDSLDILFDRYGDKCSPYITATGLEKMMNDLDKTKNVHDHDHHHHDHHHEDHNHERDHHHHHHHPGNHNHDHDYFEKHQHHDHDHPSHIHENHDHSDHDHYSTPKSMDHDHSDRTYFNHDKQNLTGEDHGYHSHPEIDFTSHSPSYKNDSLQILKDEIKNSSDSNDDASNLEVILHPMDINNNVNISKGAENLTVGNDSNKYLSVTTGNYSEPIETIFPSRLSDRWQPTTLASEESNIVNNIIPPLSSPPINGIASECLSAESLVSLYGSDRIAVSKSEFLRLCPVIVQQTLNEACDEPHISLNMPSKLEVYGYGTACVFVLCLASLSGVILLPLMRRSARHYIIAGFQGLAFSTLASDALLHLMPEFLGLHSHSHSHNHSHSHEAFPEPYAQMLLGFLATIYVLFMMEAIFGVMSGQSKGQGGHGHSHSHMPQISEPTLISIKSKSTTELPLSAGQSCSSLNTEILDVDTLKKPPNMMVSTPIMCGLTSVALVITLGDALHNFGDGLAIGAAFTSNINIGLSTAAAAFCHELPHELGDFVVLLSTGLSFSRALMLNFLSGLTAMAGLYVGILVGENEYIRKWIMATASSTFLYIALAEMIPELREHRYGSAFKMLLVKNIGIFVGVALMCLISVYEHEMA